MKVFLDTNVLISAFTTRGLSADLFRLILAEHELMTGEVNLVEFRRVLQQRFWCAGRGDWVRGVALARADRGPRADLLVTGDKDLLTVAAEAPVRILGPCTRSARARLSSDLILRKRAEAATAR